MNKKKKVVYIIGPTLIILLLIHSILAIKCGNLDTTCQRVTAYGLGFWNGMVMSGIAFLIYYYEKK